MSFAEIEARALELPLEEKASLIASLLETLPSPEEGSTELEDSVREALQREKELDSGEVTGMTLEELREGIETRQK